MRLDETAALSAAQTALTNANTALAGPNTKKLADATATTNSNNFTSITWLNLPGRRLRAGVSHASTRSRPDPSSRRKRGSRLPAGPASPAVADSFAGVGHRRQPSARHAGGCSGPDLVQRSSVYTPTALRFWRICAKTGALGSAMVSTCLG